MAEATATGQGDDWRDAIRPHVEAAWEALDQAQLALFRYYQETGNEDIARFKAQFGRAVDGLIVAVLDELFPAEDEDAPGDDCAEGLA